MNSVIRNAPGSVVQQLFVAFIDGFTEWHLKILAFAEDTRAWTSERTQQHPTYRPYQPPSLGRALKEAVPELSGRHHTPSREVLLAATSAGASGEGVEGR
jgi:hypothetical protein